ncbi:MAG: hypothetical protein WCL11_28490, partial [Verrucomicrobiota bacterium]
MSIPRDIVVMAWDTGFYRPDSLVEDGYHIINACYQPLYVVGNAASPRWAQSYIYGWNMFRWEHYLSFRPAFRPIQLPAGAPVLGAVMCSWEQKEAAEIPSLRERLPAMSERLWNPEANRPMSDFFWRFVHTDR